MLTSQISPLQIVCVKLSIILHRLLIKSLSHFLLLSLLLLNISTELPIIHCGIVIFFTCLYFFHFFQFLNLN